MSGRNSDKHSQGSARVVRSRTSWHYMTLCTLQCHVDAVTVVDLYCTVSRRDSRLEVAPYYNVMHAY